LRGSGLNHFWVFILWAKSARYLGVSPLMPKPTRYGADRITMMVCLPVSIDLQNLRRIVQQKLCEIGMLELDQFPMTERSVLKSNRVCGVYYCLHGPRSVKLTAIADFERSCLICYGSDGSRSVEEKLD
jgi:hypothetical protein